MRGNLDITLPLSDGSLSVVPAAKSVRLYESSFPETVTVVLLNEQDRVYAGTRISDDDAELLYLALGEYLSKKYPPTITITREEI